MASAHERRNPAGAHTTAAGFGTQRPQERPLLFNPSLLVIGERQNLLTVIAHQYFDQVTELVLLICQEGLPGCLGAIWTVEHPSREEILPGQKLKWATRNSAA